MITSAITVGFGGSVGLEAPIVVTGSAIGSNLSKWMRLNYRRRTLLIGCGTAGAISAIFNSPIAGVIFAIEVILTEVTISKFIPILIASVSGQLVSIILLGEDVLFSFSITEGFKAVDTPYFIGLGVICGLTSLYFTRVMFIVENSIVKHKNEFLRILIGGLGLAVMVLILPPIYGEGYETIISLMNQTEDKYYLKGAHEFINTSPYILVAFLIIVVLIKPIATALTIGSGGSGGVFAPSLFTGAIIGFIVGVTINSLMPHAKVNISNFTLIGMSGVMSGVLHAPLTSIFLIAEVTGGYTLFVPLMLVSALAYTTTSYFEKYSIYTKPLFVKGDLIPYDRDFMVLNLMKINILIEKDHKPIHPNETLKGLTELVRKSNRNLFPVVNDGGVLEGIVTLDDIRDIMFDAKMQSSVIVKTIMQKPTATIMPNEKMQSVMDKFQMTQAWNLPVIENGKYIGFLSKSRIFNSYRNELIWQNKD